MATSDQEPDPATVGKLLNEISKPAGNAAGASKLDPSEIQICGADGKVFKQTMNLKLAGMIVAGGQCPCPKHNGSCKAHYQSAAQSLMIAVAQYIDRVADAEATMDGLEKKYKAEMGAKLTRILELEKAIGAVKS